MLVDCSSRAEGAGLSLVDGWAHMVVAHIGTALKVRCAQGSGGASVVSGSAAVVEVADNRTDNCSVPKTGRTFAMMAVGVEGCYLVRETTLLETAGPSLAVASSAGHMLVETVDYNRRTNRARCFGWAYLARAS